MAKSNRDRVSDVMDALKAGLAPFVVREYARAYGSRVIDEINAALTSGVYGGLAATTVDAAVREIDAQGCLNVMQRRWDQVFKLKLGKSERGYVNILSDIRNEWAHQSAFTNDQAYEAADVARRLLEAVGEPTQAGACGAIAQELLRLRFEAEAKQAPKKPNTPDDIPTMTQYGLRPWRFVVQPHPDVRTGKYILADFVANIADVRAGRAAPEYGDPIEFFRRTYLTEGLMSLLVTGIRRLSGLGGDPVVQLQTSFGGGKTHSMLALYHLLSGNIGISQIPGGEGIHQQVDGQIDDRLSANRAVIVGTAFSPTEPRRYPDCTTNTLWGEIAYQLGGVAGYKIVETADLAGISPGSDTLVQLLEQHGPALIIIDELVAFARNLPANGGERIPAGTFDSTMTFFQSLTEAVKRSSDSMLLVSIPESENEIGGEQGKAALDILSKTIGRMQTIWTPVTATESFEIVRRRLFSGEIDFAMRDAVVNAFSELYRSNGGEFPSGVGETEYANRMKAAYPIHPELFDRLYLDWSTLDRFQRTRGVLRLMATVIHKLWDNDQSLLIMPASIPLWASSVRNEMLGYLPETWPAIVDADIDGEGSKPLQLDQSVPTLGQYSASRRIARSIFVGSAPSVAGQAVRGVEEVRIRLATVQPGEPIAVFGDALRRMSQQLTYLYTDGSRHWYDTRPSVNRMAQDRAQQVKDDDLYAEAVKRLREVKSRREDFAAAHVAPSGSGDIADDDRARIVVLPPEYTYQKKSNGSSSAMAAAKEILENRGSSPRLYRNMLVFVAADANDVDAWAKSLREYLAWKSIRDQEEQLNLTAHDRKQVQSNLDRTDETVRVRLQETYSWLLVPAQPEATGPVEFQAHRISGQETFYERAARKLRNSGLLINRWGAEPLTLEMQQFNLWRDSNHVGVQQLWEYLARDCYLPRLYSVEVLVDAIRDGVTAGEAKFAYASGVGLDGTYKGLVYQQPVVNVVLDENAVLVRPEAALQQIEAERRKREQVAPPQPPIGGGNGGTGSTGGTGIIPPSPPVPRLTTRYHGTVSVDPQRVNKEMGTIVEEIIQRLTALTGTDVNITIEISAERPAGFDDATVRTISENSRTLKFRNHGFEQE